jgi:hypothetical protein
MKWERISCTPEQEVYQLFKGETRILTLTLHPFSNSARIETESEKRVFQIRKEGFLRNKTVLLCEYGTRIGELGNENNAAYISMNDERFYYSNDNEPGGELNIYKDNKETPIVTCKGADEFKKDKKLSDISHPGLLMAVCWYMFLPAMKEKTRELASV